MDCAEKIAKANITNQLKLEEHKRNGEKNGQALMTNKQVYQYRKLYYKGLISVTKIEYEVGCSTRTVTNMLKGISYTHARGPIHS
jgi:hypothetical protein